MKITEVGIKEKRTTIEDLKPGNYFKFVDFNTQPLNVCVKNGTWKSYIDLSNPKEVYCFKNDYRGYDPVQIYSIEEVIIKKV